MRCSKCGSKRIGIFLDGSGRICKDCHTTFPPERWVRLIRRALFGERYCMRHSRYEGGWRGAYERCQLLTGGDA